MLTQYRMQTERNSMSKTIARKLAVGILASALAAFGALCLTGCGSDESNNTTYSTAGSVTKVVAPSDQFSEENLLSGKHHAVIEVEGYGPINVELDADAAPVSVTNFTNLANDGYYDGLTFYRIVDDFVLQGGTKGNNAAGTDEELEPIVGEFSSNGVKNALAESFGRGTIAMARSNVPNSAKSTFFITLDDNDNVAQSLNGNYAAFGVVDADGMAVIDQIVADYLPKVSDQSMGAIEDEANQPIIKSITILD